MTLSVTFLCHVGDEDDGIRNGWQNVKCLFSALKARCGQYHTHQGSIERVGHVFIQQNVRVNYRKVINPIKTSVE